MHIHSAVTHLLQHPPAQGKYALERLLQEINSEYFPSVVENAKITFSSGPLRRPRDSLVRNLILVLVKTLVNESPEWGRRRRINAALQATQQLHPNLFSSTLADKLSPIFRALPDTTLRVAIELLKEIPDSWQYLEQDIRQKIEAYTLNLPTELFWLVEFLLKYQPLRKQAQHRVRTATKSEISDPLFAATPIAILDRMVVLYVDSTSFSDANEWAKEMHPYVNQFNANHIQQILKAAASNSQILGSTQLPQLIYNLRLSKKMPESEFVQLLEENNLEAHI
ncbi:hypothetical protein [uncultured Deefgea sp.]|uniref:hypothetical protein n=1 Tax=uncultured Deefgea sp. TaxID=1304914 RepID=UPI00262F83F7|nr:hypothetical protein [uncultured Deefgea sp.]